MPIVAARRAGTVGISFLMASLASQSRNSLARRSSNYIRKMTMSIVALLWIVSGRVTIDAARMGKNRIHLLPCIETLLRADCRLGLRARSSDCLSGGN